MTSPEFVIQGLEFRQKSKSRDKAVRSLGTRPAGSTGDTVYNYSFTENEQFSVERGLSDTLMVQLGYQGTGIQFSREVAQSLGLSTETGFSGGFQIQVPGLSGFDVNE